MVSVSWQEGDLIAAIWMRRKRLFTGKIGWFTWTGIVCALLTCFLMIMLGPEYGLDASIGYWFLGFYVWIWVVVGSIFLLTPVKVKRLYKKLRLAEKPYSLDWDRETLRWEDQNTKSEWPWQEYTRWFEDKRIFMLLRRNVIPMFIPKRILNDKQLAELRNIFIEKIGPEGATRK